MFINTKSELRKKFSAIRKFETYEEKSQADQAIINRLISTEIYKQSNTVLIYVSVGSEVETSGIILHALSNNKTVAVPHCNGQTMEFYKLNSTDDLIIGKFNIPSVLPRESQLVIPDKNDLCIVPGLAFTQNGMRLGYGGGYYDRYLDKYTPITVGLTYEKCVIDEEFNEPHDVPLNFIITEKSIRSSL